MLDLAFQKNIFSNDKNLLATIVQRQSGGRQCNFSFA